MDAAKPVRGYEPSGILYFFFLGLVVLGFLTMLLVNGSVITTEGSQISTTGNPFFYLLLLTIIIPLPIPIMDIFLALTFLYVLLFYYVILNGKEAGTRTFQGNPVTYIGITVPFLLLLSVLIIYVEAVFGVPTGSLGYTNPYLFYLNLIYAPFVEEIGFRIIPLGILVLVEALLVLQKARSMPGSEQMSTGKTVLYSFIFPGRLRKELNIKMGWAEWTGVILTSALFGYAHYFFGGWDAGKIVQAATVGAFLAIGFIKFGPYVDILIHWFFNGFTSFVIPFSTPPADLLVLVNILWLLLCGIASIAYVVRWSSSTGGVRRENDPLS